MRMRVGRAKLAAMPQGQTGQAMTPMGPMGRGLSPGGGGMMGRMARAVRESRLPQPTGELPGEANQRMAQRTTALQRLSTRGSPPFTDQEIKRGYRKLGK